MTTLQATLSAPAPRFGLPENDPTEVLATAQRADWLLLAMVSCVAVATLALATASALLA
jgi:hypothetical protein